MSKVKILPMATDLSLAEGEVGVGTFSVTCPGIIQCFAIVGKRGNALVGTHVTPGSDQADIDKTFADLKGIGGDSVNCWYILGPKQTHYGYSRVWKSDQSVKRTFRATFGSKAKLVFLDSTAEMATLVTDPRYPNLPQRPAGVIDIRVRNWGIGLKFDHRFRVSPRTHIDGWHEFDLTKFNTM